MNTEINIEAAVRIALGDLTLQLIAARAENEALKARLAEIEVAGHPAEPPKVNGRGKEKAIEPERGNQPN